MKRSELAHNIIKLLHHYAMFFLLVAFLVSCSMWLFVTVLMDTLNFSPTTENISMAAKLTMGNILLPMEQFGTIRMAAVEDIVAMKMDVVSRGGRKKDFWDLHMLRDHYNIEQMLSLYEERYPYGATREECTSGLTNFLVADAEPDPICLQNKIWQLIKLDFEESKCDL